MASLMAKVMTIAGTRVIIFLKNSLILLPTHKVEHSSTWICWNFGLRIGRKFLKRKMLRPKKSDSPNMSSSYNENVGVPDMEEIYFSYL